MFFTVFVAVHIGLSYGQGKFNWHLRLVATVGVVVVVDFVVVVVIDIVVGCCF